MTKRFIAIFLTVIVLFSTVTTISVANEISPDEINASYYLDGYGAGLYSNGISGTLKLQYQVFGTDYMTTIGVYKIVVRNSNGTLYRTIWGSTANGLLTSNAWYHLGTYTLNLVSGNSYYCTVTVIAGNSSGSDTRTITTSVVTCP